MIRTWYAGLDDDLYVFAYRDSSWRRRIGVKPEVTVRIGDAAYSVRAVAVDAEPTNAVIRIA